MRYFHGRTDTRDRQTWIPTLATVLVLSIVAVRAQAAGDPSPGPTAPADLPQTLEDVPITVLDISWDFGDLEPPDWRRELVSSNALDRFRLRWKYTGPSIDSAALTTYDEANARGGEIYLPMTPPLADGYRYTTLQIGDLPCLPTLTMHVRVLDSAGEQIGCASNEAQITAPSPADPFLYTPLHLAGLVTDFGVPALVGGVSCNTGGDPDLRVFCEGVRKFDGGAGVATSNDRWAIGSCTKAMTCTLMAVLIQAGTPLPGGGGTVTWNTPLPLIFPEWADDMDPACSPITLRHLACHRSGLRMTGAEDGETRVTGGANDDPRTFRRDMTERLLSRPHFELDSSGSETTNATSVGHCFHYGGGNYLVLGAVIEQLTNQAFEQVIQHRLFMPLGISSAGFGLPVHPPIYYQPHGHYRASEFANELEVDNTPCPPVWNPAGSCYLSVRDWLKFLRLHLNGSEGTLTLGAGTLTVLHTPYPLQCGGDSVYGFGWWMKSEGGGRVLNHNGHYWRFFAECDIHLARGFTVCAISNLGPYEKRNASGDLIWRDRTPIRAVRRLLAHLAEKATAQQDVLGRPAPGTFAAGSGGHLGILQVNTPEGEAAGVTIDNPGGPQDQIGLEPATHCPVSLYELDRYRRTVATRAHRPRARAVAFDSTGILSIRAGTEEGAIYQFWRALTPTSRADAELLEEIMASGPETEFNAALDSDEEQGFFWIEDMLE